MSKIEAMLPQLRFEGFSGEWKTQALSDVAKIVGGGTPDTAIPEYWNGDINWYSPTEIGLTRFVKESTRKITDLGFQKSSARLLPANQTVLFTSRAGIGDMAILKAEGTTNQGFQSLIVNDHNDVYFIYSMGHLIKREALRVASGSTFLEISGKALGKIKQQFPLKKEQTKIGELFQKLDRAIELQQQKVEQSERYKKAMLQKMFPQKGEKVPRVRFEGFSGDWSEFKIGNITSSYSGGTPSVTESSYYNGDIPFIRSGEIDSKETELFITELGLNNSSAKMVEKGDILYALYGATSGEVSRSKIKGAINQAILAIRPKTQFCSEYLCQLLGFMKDEIVNKYLQGGQGNLSGAIIKDLKITLPDLKEQTQIGNFFQKLDQNIEAEKKKLEQYQTMKRAMLQRMFV